MMPAPEIELVHEYVRMSDGCDRHGSKRCCAALVWYASCECLRLAAWLLSWLTVSRLAQKHPPPTPFPIITDPQAKLPRWLIVTGPDKAAYPGSMAHEVVGSPDDGPLPAPPLNRPSSSTPRVRSSPAAGSLGRCHCGALGPGAAGKRAAKPQ